MRTCLVWALAVMVTAMPALSVAEVTGQQPTLSNVQLSQDGAMHGLMVSADGKPVADTVVRIHMQGDINRISQTIKSDRDGRFQVRGLKTGTLVVSVGDSSYACRVWNHGIAPPNSVKTAAFVTDGQVVRGQGERRPAFLQRIYSLTTKQKVCLGLIIAAAITIPIALDDDDAS